MGYTDCKVTIYNPVYNNQFIHVHNNLTEYVGKLSRGRTSLLKSFMHIEKEIGGSTVIISMNYC